MSESTDMVTEVYGHIIDEDWRKNAERKVPPDKKTSRGKRETV